MKLNKYISGVREQTSGVFRQPMSRRGFTLPEVLVSLAVLTMVIVAATNLVVSIIRTNNDNVNTLMAYGLAQEGLEGFRNVRDSNWLLSADFEGLVKGKNVWGSDIFFPIKTEKKMYVIDLLNLGNASVNKIQTSDQIAVNAPWKLTKVTENTLDQKSLIKKFYGTGTNNFRYGHNEILNLNENESEDTPFHRYLIVEGIGEDDKAKLTQMKVTSIVYWSENGRDRKVELTTELTDWNQGQL